MCLFLEFFRCCFRGVCGVFFLLFHFFQGKRKRKAPSAKSCLCKRWVFLGQRVHRPHRLESRCLPASQPAILTGRSHNTPILGKGPLVDFQIVRDGRERWTEGEPDPREGEDAGEKGAGERAGRCSCRAVGVGEGGTAARGMGDASRVMEVRGSAASAHAVASVPHWGTSLLRASCPAIRGGHTGDSLGPHRADLFW